MTIRFDDANRTVELSVLDVVEAGAPSGDLVLDTVQSSQARLAAGREVHQAWQQEQEAHDDDYRAEVRLKRQLAVGDWTVVLHGRVDGLTEEAGHPVVEEIKSTVLDAGRLLRTTVDDWPSWAHQLRVYLWMVADERSTRPVGRLVLVSLLDGAQHVLGIAWQPDEVEGYVRQRLRDLVESREERLAWLASRRGRHVPVPWSSWRPGQDTIARVAFEAVEAGDPLLVEAPTGLGKTSAILHGLLRHAFAHDRQVFWSTARTTQQRVVQETLDRFRAAGLELRVVTITAKEKVCLNDVVACRPDRCPYAAGYFDKLREHDSVARVLARDGSASEAVVELAGEHEVCPYELAAEAAQRADVVIGDYNYVFDPSARLRRLFGSEPERWVVVADEAHQLVERARGYASPRVTLQAAREARDDLRQRAGEAGLDPRDSVFAPFVYLARDIGEAVLDAQAQINGRSRDGVAVAELSATPWRRLSERIDDVALDYARLQVEHPVDAAEDPWLDLARTAQRFDVALGESNGHDQTVHLVGTREPFAGLLCLDPSGWIGPRIERLGGFVGCSATLSPPDFYQDLLGLDVEHLRLLRVPSFFPPEHRRVVVAPRVSTLYRDRPAHAPATAALLQRCVEATPGNVAVYFPSFAMLEDLVGRWTIRDREVLAQRRSMSEAERLAWLRRLGAEGPPVVLAAVLGGIFAEGIDLPPGALEAVLVTGPALPPVGLERDLLREYYDDRYGEGFRYASLVPGMTRVVQAAGRLIRRPDDRGVIVLVGRRFRWRDTASLLPADWEVEIADDPAEAVARFWEAQA